MLLHLQRHLWRHFPETETKLVIFICRDIELSQAEAVFFFGCLEWVLWAHLYISWYTPKTVIEVHLSQAAHLIDVKMKMKSLALSLTTQKASIQTHRARQLSIPQNPCVNVATATLFYYRKANWMSFESEGSCRIKNPLMLSSRMAFLTRRLLIGPVWVGEECQAGWVSPELSWGLSQYPLSITGLFQLIDGLHSATTTKPNQTFNGILTAYDLFQLHNLIERTYLWKFMTASM